MDSYLASSRSGLHRLTAGRRRTRDHRTANQGPFDCDDRPANREYVATCRDACPSSCYGVQPNAERCRSDSVRKSVPFRTTSRPSRPSCRLTPNDGPPSVVDRRSEPGRGPMGDRTRCGESPNTHRISPNVCRRRWNALQANPTHRVRCANGRPLRSERVTDDRRPLAWELRTPIRHCATNCPLTPNAHWEKAERGTATAERRSANLERRVSR